MTVDGEIAFLVNRATETSAPVDLAESLVSYGDCSVDVLSYYGDGDYESQSVAVRTVGSESKLSPDGYATLRDAVAEYDVLQVHHHFSGILGRVLASVDDVVGTDGPAVVSRVGNVRRGFSAAGRTLNAFTHPLCDRIVCNSRAVLDARPAWEVGLCGPERYRVIPSGFDQRAVEANLEPVTGRSTDDANGDRVGDANGDGVGDANGDGFGDSNRDWIGDANGNQIDDAIEDAIDDGDDVVSSVSVMTEQKDLQTLLRGIGALDDQKRRNLSVVLAGDGPRREALTELVSELDLEETVTFLGLVERGRVHRLLDRSDAFVMPSRWEGFSSAALEAMGIGTAGLFSDIAPFREAYDGYALFHEPGDHRELAAKLSRYLDDPELRAATGRAAREHVLQHYHVRSTVRSYVELYRELYRELAGE